MPNFARIGLFCHPGGAKNCQNADILTKFVMFEGHVSRHARLDPIISAYAPDFSASVLLPSMAANIRQF